MHRTTAEDFDPDVYGDGSNKRGFKSAIPGESSASRFGRASANSFQEEIANLIELTGGTLAIGPDEDKAAGWRQLYDQVYSSNHGETGMLKANSVNADRLIQESIITSKIANGAVTSDKLNDGAVQRVKIADEAVNLDKLDPGLLKEYLLAFRNDQTADFEIPATDLQPATDVQVYALITVASLGNGANGTFYVRFGIYPTSYLEFPFYLNLPANTTTTLYIPLNFSNSYIPAGNPNNETIRVDEVDSNLIEIDRISVLARPVN